MQTVTLSVPNHLVQEVKKQLSAENLSCTEANKNGTKTTETVLAVAGVAISFVSLCLQFYQMLVDRKASKNNRDTMVIEVKTPEPFVIELDPSIPREIVQAQLQDLLKIIQPE